jgi:hypothetical protein
MHLDARNQAIKVKFFKSLSKRVSVNNLGKQMIKERSETSLIGAF